jgi:DNA-binding transcriptional LysR family regulator
MPCDEVRGFSTFPTGAEERIFKLTAARLRIAQSAVGNAVRRFA